MEPLSWIDVPTPLPTGPMRLAVTPTGVAAVSYAGVPAAATGAPECTDRRVVEAVTGQLAEYFGGGRRVLELPIDWRLATGPHRVVLERLVADVGYGRTITYGELAARSGVFEDVAEPGLAARTVGQMMGANPLALLVPCHRVVASDGLGGFGGGPQGLETKRWLLTLEGVLPPTLDWDGPVG
ncbi:methylated-DNA--[protein]-cysteine S-methyltransferase [Streptomyces sp. NRRL B-24484]|uniref:methylated-DNA--[protein]-cysteine S-methyltransferase n=1 Tax=Streptomyces sp. NRRL B-24484 TaxID=1463833 RepID=UPI0004BE8114|nr:methylated-DNA--[protein]-cysteine S-methyltransferase [Streptomyces sp. NRRL B-24484]